MRSVVDPALRNRLRLGSAPAGWADAHADAADGAAPDVAVSAFHVLTAPLGDEEIVTVCRR